MEASIMLNSMHFVWFISKDAQSGPEEIPSDMDDFSKCILS